MSESENAAQEGLLEFLKQQQKRHEDQQAILLGMLEQQKIHFDAHREEMATLIGQQRPKNLPKPSLQKLMSDDDIEHYLSVFERVAQQQQWPEDMWATQLAGLLTGKAMAAYAALSQEDSMVYKTVKEAILGRFEINEES